MVRKFQLRTWVPIEPVDPTIEIGFGPSHVLMFLSGTARPGHAGGGVSAEQWTLLVPPFFLCTVNALPNIPENKNMKWLNTSNSIKSKHIAKLQMKL